MSLVLVVGDVMRDIVVRPDGPARRGTDQRATIRTMPGGSGANQAAWLAHAGLAVRLLACVADTDLSGERRRLRARGVEPALVGHPDLPTGQLIALIDRDGERSFLTDRGANDGLRLTALPSGVLSGVRHCHVSGYAFVGAETCATARHLIREATAEGLPVSFDPGSAGFLAEIGPRNILDWTHGADLCLANADEAEVLTGQTAVDAQLIALNRSFPLVVLKRGAAGAVARHRDGPVWSAPAHAVEVVDTIGAGDAFLAGFLAGALSGAPVDACLSQAVALGALAVAGAGGLPPFKSGARLRRDQRPASRIGSS